MKIQRIAIENFRGIKKLDLDLTSPVTVLVGENGAGKSSILDCLATLLSWYPARMRSPKGGGARIKQKDISLGEHITRTTASAIFQGDEIKEWSLATARKGSGKSGTSQIKDLGKEAENQAALMIMGHAPIVFTSGPDGIRSGLTSSNQSVDSPSHDFTGNPETSTPLIVHYSVNRAVLEIPLRVRGRIDLADPFLAFDGAFEAKINFRSFFAWFRQREDLEHEKRIGQLEGTALPKPQTIEDFFVDHQLEAVRQAIEKLTGFSNLKVRRDPLHMELTKNGKTFWIDHLSDGEKCLLALAGDLARRLATLSGKHLKDPLQNRGVVLVDEIDLHLHPKWQREIIPKLVATFPNCQFVVTTHSPQVIGDIKPECVFLLRQEEGNVTLAHPEESYGQTSDRILEDIMDVPARREDIKMEFRSLFDLISQGELKKAKEKVNKLREEVINAPELVRASTLIHRQEVLGK
jgi:predicted ATP-binding protein involved in virulence